MGLHTGTQPWTVHAHPSGQLGLHTATHTPRSQVNPGEHGGRHAPLAPWSAHCTFLRRHPALIATAEISTIMHARDAYLGPHTNDDVIQA